MSARESVIARHRLGRPARPFPGPLVAIVGGGASGALAAIALMERTAANIVVIEPRPRLGRGVAYSTPDPLHRLNVPAGTMSAHRSDPDHLVRWLATRLDGAQGPLSFPRRNEYGVYLAQSLRDAAARRRRGRLTHVRASATSVRRSGHGWLIELAEQGTLHADAVVLAVGTAPPRPVAGMEALYSHPAYIADPWSDDAVTRLPDGPLLCLGTGLTAVDVALSAGEWSRCSTVLAVSRHGLRPLAHRSEGAPGWVPRLAAGRPATALGLLRTVRAEVALATARGLDWRDVINGLRPDVPALWAALSEPERHRVVSRLGRFWEVHRHRLSPEVAGRVGDMERAGRLRFTAGRLEGVEPAGRALEVSLRHPDGSSSHHVVAAVVNCTGRSGEATEHPLLARMHADGLCRRGSARLGIACDANGIVLDAMGQPTGMLALGPLRRGDLWESTAVPEIREQAFAIAETIARHRARAARMTG